jgi:hypothetical protein
VDVTVKKYQFYNSIGSSQMKEIYAEEGKN